MLYLSQNKLKLSTLGVMKYFSEIVMGIKYLHDHNILHRDLKPENVFVTQDNVCVIGDFGLSKELTNASELTNSRVGSPLYMAPEIFNRKAYNFSADIWSLGCLLYELCELKPYFSEACDLPHLVRLQKIPFKDSNKRVRSSLDQTINDMIAGCLELEPSKRMTINEIYHHPLIQNFIRSGCRTLMYSFDTKGSDLQVYKIYFS